MAWLGHNFVTKQASVVEVNAGAGIKQADTTNL